MEESPLWLKRIHSSTNRMINDDNIAIGDVIKLDYDLKDTTFKYKDNYYTANDFVKIEITNNNDENIKLFIDDYNYINFTENDISNLEYEIVTITKPMIPGCAIKRNGKEVVFGEIVKKAVEDYNFSTYAYKYKKPDGSWSDIRIGVYNEWYSVDVINVMILTKLEKIKYILRSNNNTEDKLSEIYKVVLN